MDTIEACEEHGREYMVCARCEQRRRAGIVTPARRAAAAATSRASKHRRRRAEGQPGLERALVRAQRRRRVAAHAWPDGTGCDQVVGEPMYRRYCDVPAVARAWDAGRPVALCQAHAKKRCCKPARKALY